MKSVRLIKIGIAIVLAIVAWLVSPTLIGIPDLTIVERHMIAITIAGITMWLSEAFPLWVTSIVISALMLFTISDCSPHFLYNSYSSEVTGTLIPYTQILASFADPSLVLFTGGFFFALGATHSGLDVRIARSLLRPFGYRSEMVLLGFMTITTLISMFVSNTATAALMLAIAMPIIRSLDADSNGRAAIALGIALAANIGGMGTPIGSPPNQIALQYLNATIDPQNVLSFADWTFYMFPVISLLTLVAWLLLIWLLPFHNSRISIDLPERRFNANQSIIVIITFLITFILLITSEYFGSNIYLVGSLPIVIFCVTGVIKTEDLQKVNWEIIWLAAGSFALSIGLKETHLAQHIIENFSFSSWPPLLIVVGPGLLCFALSQFMSNTAVAAIFIPIIATTIKSIEPLIAPYGGATAIIVCLAFASSLAMALPISTPSNAIAYGLGNIKQRKMIAIGLSVGIFGLITTYVLFIYLSSIIY